MYRALRFSLSGSLLALLFLPLPTAAVEVSIDPPDPAVGDLIEVHLTDGACNTLQVEELDRPADDLFRVGLTPHPTAGPACDPVASPDGAPALAVGPLAPGGYRLEVLLGGDEVAAVDFTVGAGNTPSLSAQIETTPLPWHSPNLFLVEASGTWTSPLGVVPTSVRVDHNLIHVEAVYEESPLAVLGAYAFETTVGPLPGGFYTVVVQLRAAAASGPGANGVVTASRPLAVPSGPPPTDCERSPTTLCLNRDRFRVSVSWDTGDEEGDAGAVPLSPESGGFWFFRRDNLELVIKVLDGCAAFDRYWVFAAGLTNVGVDIEVVDTSDGTVWRHHTEPGEGFAAVRDTGAFHTCP